MKTQTKQTADLSKLFILDDYEGTEQQAFLDEVGTLVFQSALMQYLVTHDEAEVKIFEGYISEHIGAESFVDSLCVVFPEFEKVLLSEMTAFQQEIISED